MSDTVVRAFELPVNVVEPREAWETIRECWKQATMLANWCVQQLLRNDVVRLPGMVKLAKMPKINGKRLKGLYGLASETFGFTQPGNWWTGACRSASTICRDVERKYISERLNVIWHRKQAPCTYRYPYPWPIHAQAWRQARLDRNGRPCIEVVLPSQEFSFPDGGVGIQLRGGAEFGRQMGLFRQVVNGSLPMFQLVIREQHCSPSCHRPRLEAREDSRVLVKMVAELPCREKLGDRVLTLITDPNAFWVAELDGRQAWVLNNDHMKRAFAWLAAHEDRLDRLAQDSKAERRLNPDALGAINRSRGRCCRKHHNRMASWLHETAAHLVGFAQRNRVGTVLYSDLEQGHIERFPWFKLKALLKDKLKATGIVCRCASDGEEETAA
jgi:hypothetical protein